MGGFNSSSTQNRLGYSALNAYMYLDIRASCVLIDTLVNQKLNHLFIIKNWQMRSES